MKPFKTFVLEKILSRKEGIAKLKNIAQGRNEIPTAPVMNNVGISANPAEFKDLHGRTEPKKMKKDPTIRKELAAKVQRVPLNKVFTSQGHVWADGVEKKIKGTGRNDPPIPIFVKRKDGTYKAPEGNHRTFGRILRNFTHTRAAVVDEE